ncbi:22k protein [Cynomolgus adenovirus 1]|uniref:22k protein n=1 Tax=Cynomolgus adenovirus 1 TaxID=507488 RepID=A0A1C8EGN2_9ADEN|nr:22k protein [Cynomolgus adenovirus 1]ALM55127.1 22k protein [Cynomolgus adenovirus 1]
MAPKRQTQLLREKRSKKQEQRLPPTPETWDEESQDSWESQAATTEEEDWEETSSVGEAEEQTDEEQAEEETPSAAAPSRSVAGPKTPRPPAPTPPLPPKKANRRWDAKTPAPAAPVGKMLAGQRRQRGAYCSWRAYKSDILACLLHCGGNVSFTRRYLLFHRGVAVPRNVLHYYRHLYSPFHQQPQFPETARQRGEPDLRAPGHAADAGAENADLSHAVRHFSAEPRAATRTEN